MSEQLIRLNKAIAESGYCARRKADELIFNKKVKVNEELIISPGHKVAPNDVIKINDQELKPSQVSKCYLILHKPIQVVSTAADPEGRSTVLDYIPPKYQGRRLYPVGRLDYFSEGLILLTDDGEFANRMSHPRYHLPRHYEVLVRGQVNHGQLNAMRNGMRLSEGEELAKIIVTTEQDGANTILRMTLSQGLNRQIRRMCRDLDLTILKLLRIGLGPLKLGDLKKGQVRELTEKELAGLKNPSN